VAILVTKLPSCKACGNDLENVDSFVAKEEREKLLLTDFRNPNAFDTVSDKNRFGFLVPLKDFEDMPEKDRDCEMLLEYSCAPAVVR
jgi:hypothetical protein